MGVRWNRSYLLRHIKGNNAALLIPLRSVRNRTEGIYQITTAISIYTIATSKAGMAGHGYISQWITNVGSSGSSGTGFFAVAPLPYVITSQPSHRHRHTHGTGLRTHGVSMGQHDTGLRTHRVSMGQHGLAHFRHTHGTLLYHPVRAACREGARRGGKGIFVLKDIHVGEKPPTGCEKRRQRRRQRRRQGGRGAGQRGCTLRRWTPPRRYQTGLKSNNRLNGVLNLLMLDSRRFLPPAPIGAGIR